MVQKSGGKNSNLKQTHKSSHEKVIMDDKGIIVGHYGVAVDVRFSDGHVRSVRVKRNSGHVVGDRVIVKGEVLKRLSRETEIYRRSKGGSIHVIAANLDILGITVTSNPPYPEGFIDRTIVAARSSGVEPFIVVNKCDISESEQLYEKVKEIYNQDIDIFNISALTGKNLAKITSYIKEGYLGAFVGISGVGKSSILNRIYKELDLEVGELSETSGFGKHTTTTSTLHKIPGGGELIDTPGFRDFGLVEIPIVDLATYFYGFEKILEQRCRFNNCIHENEPGCIVRKAVDDGIIFESRYASYIRIMNQLKKIHEDSGYGNR